MQSENIGLCPPIRDKEEQLPKAIQIGIEMLQQRDYTIDDIQQDRVIGIKPDGKKMIMFLSSIPKFNVKCMSEYISITNEFGIKHLLIVYKDGVTASTKKAIEQLQDDIYIELFAEENLQFNITKHRLQPVFQRLEENESKEFKLKYGLKFPIMKKDDPIASFYDYHKGDIIRIIRKNGIIDYRIVK
jgi:DNA-directed RNA polymerase subunit H (RpoH/RPB5)